MAAISPKERRALAILFGMAVIGHLLVGAQKGAQVGAQHAAPLPAPLLDSSLAGDPLAHRDSLRRLATPLVSGERIDVDRASAGELGRLPGIGPALAKRIVADRENRGAFGGIAALDRVAGIGPAMLARLGPHLTFSGRPADAQEARGEVLVDLNRATVAELDALPGIGSRRARAIVAFRDSAGPFRQIEDLKRVSGMTVLVVQALAGRVTIR